MSAKKKLSEAAKLEKSGKPPAAAAKSVVEAANQSGSYAYRFEEFGDGSAAAVWSPGPGQEARVTAFASLEEASSWHPKTAAKEAGDA